MKILDSHDPDHPDALQRPSFGRADRLRRMIWKLGWLVLFRPVPVPFHAWRCAVLRCFGAKIGRTNFIYPSAVIWAPWLLETEDVVTIGPGVEVYNPGGVYLGHHVILSQDAYLCGATHDYNSADFTYLKRRILAEPYAWVCAKAVVLPGVTLGEGCVLGSASVTSKSLEPWTVYAGNPARAVRPRARDIQTKAGGSACS